MFTSYFLNPGGQPELGCYQYCTCCRPAATATKATGLCRLRRVAQPLPQAYQPQPATAEELTRDLAGWSLPQSAPLGRASTSWLW